MKILFADFARFSAHFMSKSESSAARSRQGMYLCGDGKKDCSVARPGGMAQERERERATTSAVEFLETFGSFRKKVALIWYPK